MCIAKQKQAIKNCFKIYGYNSCRVICVRVNSNDRTLKVFKVDYGYGMMSKDYLHSINLLIDNSGIIGVRTESSNYDWCLLVELNALHKALQQK